MKSKKMFILIIFISGLFLVGCGGPGPIARMIQPYEKPLEQLYPDYYKKEYRNVLIIKPYDMLDSQAASIITQDILEKLLVKKGYHTILYPFSDKNALTNNLETSYLKEKYPNADAVLFTNITSWGVGIKSIYSGFELLMIDMDNGKTISNTIYRAKYSDDAEISYELPKIENYKFENVELMKKAAASALFTLTKALDEIPYGPNSDLFRKDSKNLVLNRKKFSNYIENEMYNKETYNTKQRNIRKSSTIRPLINECCLSLSKKNVTKKKIYIASFNIGTINNSNNLAKNYYKQPLISKYFLKNIVIKDLINKLVKEEFQRRLTDMGYNIVVVDEIPNNLDLAKSIIISGAINQPIVKSATMSFNNNNQYDYLFNFTINTKLNGKEIKDDLNAVLSMRSQLVDYEHKQNLHMNVLGALMIPFSPLALSVALGSHDSEDIGTNIIYQLSIDSESIANIQYYYWKEDAVAGDRKYKISANILQKDNVTNIKDLYEDTISINTFNKTVYPGFHYNSFNSLLVSPYFLKYPVHNSNNHGFPEKNYLTKTEIEQVKNDKLKYLKCRSECNPLNPNECDEKCPEIRNIENTKYYDIFKQYTSVSGVIQLMINKHIDNVIKKLNL